MSDLPCKTFCFRWQQCVRVCETLKEVQGNATSFPCVAAGYCPALGDGSLTAEELVDLCTMRPLLRCEPATHCHRATRGLRVWCEPKPGVARWLSMQASMAQNTGALASALATWPSCAEPDAGPFCVAEPAGSRARAAAALSTALPLGWGALASLRALLTAGGDDDRHWLCFWILCSLLSHVEGYAKVLLTRWFPPYYEARAAHRSSTEFTGVRNSHVSPI